MKTISIPCAEGARRQDDPADTARKAAERYTNRGWHVIPIPHRTKCNKTKGWEQWRMKP